MFDYIEEIIIAFEKVDSKLKDTIASAVPENLCKVNENCEKLSLTEAMEFHKIVAKILYTTKRARLDTYMTVTFLTIRVQALDKND